MYENMTLEAILKSMLLNVPDTFDKREGSVIYDALAPVAIEIRNMYIDLDNILNQTFADTAAKKYLIRRCKERGIEIEPATKAIRKGVFNIDVPIGSRFSLNVLNYVVTEKISDGEFKLECETPGTAGNKESGTMIPIDYIEGLETAVLSDILVNGEDEEDVEHLRQRYFESFDSQAFGGNCADYKKKIKALPDVGGVKVYRTPNGGGTVKAVILDSAFSQPTENVVTAVQNAIDPPDSHGEGLGIAPIGHSVEVVAVGEFPITVKSKITLYKQYDWDAASGLIQDAVDEYFTELAKEWEESGENELIVRIAKIESKILETECVFDVADTLLNNKDENVYVGKDSIPVLKDGVQNVQ
jgi:uncharacterized phage protein gp47/JayE